MVRTRRTLALLLAGAVGLTATVATAAQPSLALAATAPDGAAGSVGITAPAPSIGPAPPGEWWTPGNIVEDWLFYDGYAMSAAEIQVFLESKGSQLSAATWTVRAFTAADGTGGAGHVYCKPIAAASSVPTSQVIALIAQACDISPKAILATLQKESSIVTGSLYYMQTAMGYACPDTAPCDTEYYGFVNQIYWAARQFQVYRQRPTLFNFRAGVTYPSSTANYTIGWGPSCIYNAAASPVTIENAATAGLYNYTPYQPVAEVITGGSSPISGCSAYGNYNFWRFWWLWFGDPHGGDPAFVSAIYRDLLGREAELSGLRYWSNYIGSTGDYTGVVNALLYSVESRTTAVQRAYQDALRRDGEANGVAYWVSVTGLGGIPIDNLRTTLMTSAEYYNQISDGTDTGYVTHLYQDILHRDPSAADITYWTSLLPEIGRDGLVWNIYNATESLNSRIDALYQTLFERVGDANGKAYWGPILRASDDNALRLTLVRTPEYVSKANASYVSPF